MGLRELKETAHQQYVKGKFAECMKTYQKVLRLAPRDPNMRVRHAEACRRAGERLQAIASYREAANLLLELGCETRARGALKAALELDPHDIVLQDDVARLTPQTAAVEEAPSEDFFEGPSRETAERGELPLLPPLDEDSDPFAPHALLAQQAALPQAQRALPAAPSVPPLVPHTRGMRSAAPGPHALPPITRTRPMAAPAPSLAAVPPRVAAPGFTPQDSRSEGTPPRAMTAGHAPPVLQPVGIIPGPMMTPPLPPRSMPSGLQASAASGPRRPSQVTGEVMVPPPPPPEALLEERHSTSVAPPPRARPAARAPMEVRRLSPNVLAFRGSPTDGWALIRSRTPFEIHLVEDLENLPPELSDLTLEPSGEGAASAMH